MPTTVPCRDCGLGRPFPLPFPLPLASRDGRRGSLRRAFKFFKDVGERHVRRFVVLFSWVLLGHPTSLIYSGSAAVKFSDFIPALLVAQSPDRIDPGGAARRYETGDQCDGRQQDRRDDQCCGVIRRYLIQEGRHRAIQCDSGSPPIIPISNDA